MCVHTKIFIWIFIAALFITVQSWKPPKWINKCGIPHSGVPLSTKRNKMLMHSILWVNPKSILLSEKKLNMKDYILVFHLYVSLEKAKLRWHKVSQQLPWGQELGPWINCKGVRGNILGWWTCRILITEWLYHCIQLANFINLCTWNFILWRVCLNKTGVK